MSSVPIKLGLFLLALVAIFGVAYAIGSALDPISTSTMAPANATLDR